MKVPQKTEQSAVTSCKSALEDTGGFFPSLRKFENFTVDSKKKNYKKVIRSEQEDITKTTEETDLIF